MEVHASGDLGSNNRFTEIRVGNGGQNHNYSDGTTVYNITHEGKISSSVISMIIKKLASVDLEEIDDDYNFDLAYIDRKVVYNNLDSWKEEIDLYTPATMHADRIYAEYAKQGLNYSFKVMQRLHLKYKKLKRQGYEGDLLFDQLHDWLMDQVSTDIREGRDILDEDIDINARIVLIDAFVECEIFEKPQEEC